MIFARLSAPIALVMLSGCATNPFDIGKSLFQTKAEKALATGVEQYDDGKYVEATAKLQDALNQGLATDNQVKAHKYLAFTYCVSGKERLCRDEFKKALQINPALELAQSEAGHPIWGPVFKSVKARKKPAPGNSNT